MTSAASPGREAAAPSRSLRDDLVWLVCPVCRSSLELVEARDAAGAVPGVRCKGCNRSYPVADGLPVLLAERAGLTSATKV